MSTHTATKLQSQAASHFSANASGLLQRKCACGNHTVAGGECEACRKKREGMLQRAPASAAPVNGVPPIVHDALRLPGQLPDAATRALMEPRFGGDFSRIPTHSPAAGAIQTKLAINQPGDEYEQEADRIADQVLAAPAHPAVSGAYPHIQRFVGQSTGETDTVPASVDRVLASSGRPLDPALQQDMEQRFGHDFSQVRVHSGAAAEQSARDVNAHAYTMGHNIVFGAGRFAPGTHEGRRLIAHELTHTIQQSEVATSGRANPVGPLPFGISNVARTMSGLVQRSWIGDRIDWVRTATKENNWAGSDPPGAYYVLNGLSIDDMVQILRALTPAHRKKLSDNLDEHGAGFDRPRLHLALEHAATVPGDTAFRESSENLHWAIRSGNYAIPPDGAFNQLAAAKRGQRNRLLAALNRDALKALVTHRDEGNTVPGGADVLGATILHKVVLAEIQGLPMYDLLIQLSKLPENIFADEEAGKSVGGSILVIAIQAVKAKMDKGLVDFLANNRRGLQALPPDQAGNILSFLGVPEEINGQKTINTDLEVNIIIAAPSKVRLRGELGDKPVGVRGERELQLEGMNDSGDQPSPDAISEFEEGLLNDRRIISGVVHDPETGEIIGYRTNIADGISTLVDREGEFVSNAGTPLGLEPPIVDPIDFLPAGKAVGVAKSGVGVVAKVIAKGALKKAVVPGGKATKVTLGAIVKMRSVSRTIAKSGGRKAARFGGRVIKHLNHKVLRSGGAPIDKRLLEIAIQHRTALMNAGQKFGTHNVAVVKLLVDGTPYTLSARNIVKGFHSEVRLIEQIESLIGKRKTVEVLQIFSERIPCSSCMMITKRFPKADIFYSVAEDLKETTGSNAKSLMVAYGLIP